MPRSFGRLPFLGRRSKLAEPSLSDGAAANRAPIDLDLAPLGPPVLLPSAIVRQVLLDATELVPAWAMPRAEPKATTKRAHRPKATGTPAATPAAKPRRSRKREG
jgi:hypothetical protein